MLVEVAVDIIIHAPCLHRSKHHQVQVVMHQIQCLVKIDEQTPTSYVTTTTHLVTELISPLRTIYIFKE